MEDNVSDQQGARGYRLARTSLICGVIGFSFWLLSYSWVPFALTGHKAGELVGYVFIARRRSRAGSSERRWASLGLAMGAVVLVLIVGLNLLGLVFHL